MPEDSPLPAFEYAQRLPGNFQFPARMTVLPLEGGKLALISPIPIDGSLAAELNSMGQVAFLIAPNLLHHLYLGAAIERYPNAMVLAPERLRAKRPDLRIDGFLEHSLPPVLSSSVEVVKFAGFPTLDEFVFLHRARRTLVVTDLVFNIRNPRGFLANSLLFLVGCRGRFAQSRAVRFTIKDRAAAAASAEAILSLDFDAVVVAHGENVPSNGREALMEALRWLLPERAALPALR
jgi:hypothetical protein